MYLKTVEERFRDFQTKRYHENAKAPPVASEAVLAAPFENLRGEVLGGPAQGPRPVADPLGEAEVCYLQVSVPEDIEND